MSQSCPRQGCTFGTTNICLLNVDPADRCPVLLREVAADVDELDLDPLFAEDNDDGSVGSAIDSGDVATGTDAERPASLAAMVPTAAASLTPPRPAKQALSPGRELGLDGLSRLARQRPVRLIGMLGAPDAGKTMALVSMFLLAARGKLDGYEYRNSESAFAFDELSKGARAWAADGEMLEQIVPHTELADERRPGFLHMRLHGALVDGTIDLTFPDLPGEWTDTLINKGVYDRLAFFKNADAIWIFADGAKLANVNFGHAIAARTCSLIGRLATCLPVPVPLKLVITRADQYDKVPAAILDPITEEAADKGFALEVHEIISVDKADKTRSGEGIPRLLNASIALVALGAATEPSPPAARRQIMRYRSRVAE